MTPSAVVVSLVIGMALLGNPAAADDPSPAPTTGGSVTVTIPLVGGVNDGGSGTGGGTGGNGGGGTSTCTVLDPPAAPTPAGSPTTGVPHLTVKPSRAAQGSDVEVTSTGFQAGEKVQLVGYPGARVLGSVTARPDGSLDSRIRIPAKLPIGTTVIEATGWLDCHQANGSVLVISPVHQGLSLMPWLAWIVAGGSLLIVAVILFIAVQLGWLPFFVLRRIA